MAEEKAPKIIDTKFLAGVLAWLILKNIIGFFQQKRCILVECF